MEDFQSKDGTCSMSRIEITEVDSFYSSCDKCGTWVDYKRKEGMKDSHQALLDAKKIFANIIIDLREGRLPLAHDIQEAIFAFMQQHPLPQNSIEDFEMTFETKESRHSRVEKALSELPKYAPHIFIDPDLWDDGDKED
jgi:hypothetical protein